MSARSKHGATARGDRDFSRGSASFGLVIRWPRQHARFSRDGGESCSSLALHAIGYIHPAGQRYLYVDEVDADESFRRQGVATALMRAAQEIAREMAATAVWLGAESANDAAHALYRSLGPQEVEPGVIYTYTIDPSNDKHGGA